MPGEREAAAKMGSTPNLFWLTAVIVFQQNAKDMPQHP
jgi:hypothetical protein